MNLRYLYWIWLEWFEAIKWIKGDWNLHGLKFFSQEYRQLWVEVNFTVSAYDELKMCKSRTQAVDPIELEDESELESKLIISKYEVSIWNAVLRIRTK